MTDELSRLRSQVSEAEAALHRLTEQRQAALDGRGPSPRQSDLDRAKARLEAAQALLRTYERTTA